jgi:hypothetical protein
MNSWPNFILYINIPYIRVLLQDTHDLSPFGLCHLQNQFLSYSICLSVRPSDDRSEIPSSVILLTEELHQERKSINFF